MTRAYDVSTLAAKRLAGETASRALHLSSQQRLEERVHTELVPRLPAPTQELLQGFDALARGVVGAMAQQLDAAVEEEERRILQVWSLPLLRISLRTSLCV